MTGLELLIEDIGGRLHAAIVNKTVLQNLYVDAADPAGRWASIYLGKVTKIDKKLNAAIIDLGNGLSGILPVKHSIEKNSLPPTAPHSIADAVSTGQLVLVQIKSEGKRASQNEGQKLARLTMKLHIMGQYTHHTPLNPQILNADLYPPLAGWLSDKGGWVIRRPSLKAETDKIKTEALNLLKIWQDIRTEAAQLDMPRLLKSGPNALESVMNDYGSDVFDHIHVADRACLDKMIGWSQLHDAPLAGSKRLRLFKPEKPRQRLFDIYELHAELENLTESRIEMADGGSVIIEDTAALTVIDVNQGGSNDSLLSVNLRAADEITRQIRMRNLSGAILIDFIGMGQKSDRLQLYNRLEALLAPDAINSQVHGFTRLGIIEITRKRRTPSYTEKLKSAS